MHKTDFEPGCTYIIRQRDIRPRDNLGIIKGKQQIIMVLDIATVPKERLKNFYQSSAHTELEKTALDEMLCIRNTDNEVQLLHPLTIASSQLLKIQQEK